LNSQTTPQCAVNGGTAKLWKLFCATKVETDVVTPIIEGLLESDAAAIGNDVLEPMRRCCSSVSPNLFDNRSSNELSSDIVYCRTKSKSSDPALINDREWSWLW